MNLEDVKKELSSDEKLLAQAFQLEKFYKKHKIKILTTLAVIIIVIVGLNLKDYIHQKNLEAANSALLALQKDPNNKEALNTLKSKNPKLYALYEYSVNANSANLKGLEDIKTTDAFLQDVIKYHQNVIKRTPGDSLYYNNLAVVEKAYKLIKEGKKDEAKELISTVPSNSPVFPVARLLKHLTIK